MLMNYTSNDSTSRESAWPTLSTFMMCCASSDGNIRRSTDPLRPSKWNMWYFNWKVAARTAGRNKMLYAIKTIGVSICLAFTLILTAFVIHELSYDEFNNNHSRIFRITSRVDFHDHLTHYAVTPLPIGR